jgi:hypothetical protein
MLQVSVTNETTKPFSIDYRAGQIFENGLIRVVLLKPLAWEVAPGASESKELPVVALTAEDRGDRGSFTPTTEIHTSLEPLIRQAASNPALTTAVLQTATLAITEDAPVDVFARFPRPQAQVNSANERLKVNTTDIVAAIELLQAVGVRSPKLAADPHLQVEAMIDPECHDAAMRIYGISPESEWQFWRTGLLDGDPSVRHYSLYGIARFYPDVALRMMPRWALETRLPPHYRRAAIGALALTRRFEAGPILRTLQQDLRDEGELAQCVTPALKYLEQNISNAL